MTTSTRFQDKLSSVLSGWYTGEWEKTILWHDGRLMVKDRILAEEIIYNLEEDGFVVELKDAVDPKFEGWASVLEFTS